MIVSRLLACALLSAGLVFTAAPAEAAVYTSTGVRCTIVGTIGNDRLQGTASRDVICGRGGNDTIYAGGGNDVVDAGGGADKLYGGAGGDRLIGGYGVDRITGADGSDVLVGGPGGDTISGGSHGDVLRGHDGNDDLAGGPGGDILTGGPGTNWCTVEAGDSRTGCVHDRSAPWTGALRFSAETVDVTLAAKTVDLRMHLYDDTGISAVQVGVQDSETAAYVGGGTGQLVSGTVRDGWWHERIQVPRWVEPADYEVWVVVRDRVNQTTNRTWSDPTLKVLDRNPDRSAPVVLSLASPTSSTTVDVRASGRTVRVRARLADSVSGIEEASFCPMRPLEDAYATIGCASAVKVSGSLNDGWWEGDLVIPRGSVGGDWNVSIWLTDRAHAGMDHFWMGPDDYRTSMAGGVVEPRNHQLPNGSGRFRVIGTSDSQAPVIASLTATPTEADTLTSPVTVTAQVRATDVEGVTSVGAHLGASTNDPSAPSFAFGDFTLVSGTRRDGIWRGQLVLPQGTPPDTYTFQAWVEDVSHWRSYVSVSSPYAGDPNQATLPGDPKVVVLPAG